MKKIYVEIFQKAKPFLKKGKNKDFVKHTKWVIKSMEMLLEKEKGDESILMPAAILHDVGWAKVPLNLQNITRGPKAKKALELHIKYCPLIAKNILNDLNYDKIKIKKIIDVIVAHNFRNSRDLNKRLLIDADNLSDIFKEPFYEDVKQYKITPQQNYDCRKENKFYTKTAKIIFDRELEKRRKENNISK